MTSYELETIPRRVTLEREMLRTPEFMRPNDLPSAVVCEGFLSDSQCESILSEYGDLEPYRFNGCGAITRELPSLIDPGPLKPLIDGTRAVNQLFWDFKLDYFPHAWLQTYEKGMDYALHTDAAPGQMRKLTAVAFLTDPLEYDGGYLRVKVEPRSYSTPKTRGTIVVFPSWVPHYVESIREGKRQTINLGFWGPNFR